MPVDYIRHSECTFDARVKTEAAQEKDAPLTYAGVTQATTLSGNYDVVICSPLMCARQTLLFSNIVAGKIEFSEMVREVLDGNVAHLLANESTTLAEPSASVDRRVQQVHERTDALRAQGKSVLVVSHHNFLLRLLGVSLPNGAGITTS
jgi:broad specificity phosphatase PhoE